MTPKSSDPSPDNPAQARATRQQAQQRADRIGQFRAELAELEREQALALTPEQSTRLEAHLEELLGRLRQKFGVDATESARRISWGMRLASLLGAIALFAAAVLFLQRIWGYLPPAGQVSILLVTPLLLLGAAEWAYARQAPLYYVGLLALAAGVGFAMELGTLGGVLNLTPSVHVLLVYGLFALLLAYAYGLKLLLAAGAVLVCAYSAGVAFEFKGASWFGLFQETQYLLPGAALLYAVPWATKGRGPQEFALVYRLCGGGVSLGALLLLSTMGDLCCGGLSPRMTGGLYQIFGLLLSVGIVWHGVRLARSGLVNLGVVSFVTFLYLRLHAWWWDWMPKYVFFLLIGLIALGLLLVFRALRARVSGEEAA
ncbi:MAG: DUF2157 domain-containing protein [Verrucomicrobia bacterium]|nr:DUF2157 domain-containing protein [Verrucomicrobiota bacterium]